MHAVVEIDPVGRQARREIVYYNTRWRRRAARFAEELAERISFLRAFSCTKRACLRDWEDRVVRLTHLLGPEATYDQAGYATSVVARLNLQMLAADVVRAERWAFPPKERRGTRNV